MRSQYRGRVDNRRAIGSWISGPRAAAEDMGVEFGYRGQQLGLPEEGPGSIARPGRRFAALFIDWALCLLIAYGLLSGGKAQAASNWALVVFAVLSVLTVGTVGFTPGKRLLGLRVISEDGGGSRCRGSCCARCCWWSSFRRWCGTRTGGGCTIASHAPYRSVCDLFACEGAGRGVESVCEGSDGSLVPTRALVTTCP